MHQRGTGLCFTYLTNEMLPELSIIRGITYIMRKINNNLCGGRVAVPLLRLHRWIDIRRGGGLQGFACFRPNFSIEIIKTFLKAGANPKPVYDDGDTLLHKFARKWSCRRRLVKYCWTPDPIISM